MGHLLQASSLISDTLYVNGSIWFRSPVDNVLINLIEASDPAGISPTSDSFYIQVAFGTTPFIGFFFRGLNRNISFEVINTGPQPARFLPATWYHLCFGFDMNHKHWYNFLGSSYAVVDPRIANVRLNAHTYSVGDYPKFLLDGTPPLGELNWADDEIFNAVDSVPDPILFSSQKVGVPTIYRTDIGHPIHPIVDLGDYQLWTGTYIDWTIPANFSKIVTVNNGIGTPAPTSGAATAFGTQKILFKGKASDNSYYTNQGIGGPFTLVGTATNFIPSPSY